MEETPIAVDVKCADFAVHGFSDMRVAEQTLQYLTSENVIST